MRSMVEGYLRPKHVRNGCTPPSRYARHLLSGRICE
jgi:hypothetical protein